MATVKRGSLMERLKAAVFDPEERSPHSKLYLWMLANHDGFAALLEGKKPDWKLMAEILAEGDEPGGIPPLTDALGQPPTPITTRQTWWKVRRDHAAMAAGGAKKKRAKRKAAPKQEPKTAPLKIIAARVIPPAAAKRAAAPPAGPVLDGHDPLSSIRETLAERSGRRPKR